MRQSKKIHGPDVRLSSKLFYARIRAMSKEDAGCWIWQSSKTPTGVPMLTYAGKINSVRRMILQAENKKIPKGYSASTCCDNMDCVNPEHIKLMTVADRTRRAVAKVNKQVLAYRLFKAASPRLAKLNEGQVREIKSADLSARELAKLYPVSESQIRRIKSGEDWAHVKTWGMM